MRPSNRGSTYTPILVLVIAMAIGASVIGVVADPDFKQEIRENRENFERYCTERFGDDAYVYNGGSQGVHAGLHCEDEEHKPVHLGAVEPSTWEAYKNGDASAEEVTNSVREVGFMGNVKGTAHYQVQKTLLYAGGLLGAILLVAKLRAVYREADG